MALENIHLECAACLSETEHSLVRRRDDYFKTITLSACCLICGGEIKFGPIREDTADGLARQVAETKRLRKLRKPGPS